ncbi:MAG: hypothetical protein DHS20C18_33460 [Saprospiraceae bacterium]|nr:MAG: hypothetical protein DHS20C18_33460 [Saprospiraceae bacterium]
MKYVHSFLVLLCFALPLSLMAQSSHVGDWQTKIPAEDGTMLALKVSLSADGTFAVDFGNNGTIEINGKYEVSDNQITIQDISGPNSCTTGKGVYKLDVSETTMTMTRISDGCEGRGGPDGVMAWTRS